jgi:hypothetical protein
METGLELLVLVLVFIYSLLGHFVFFGSEVFLSHFRGEIENHSAQTTSLVFVIGLGQQLNDRHRVIELGFQVQHPQQMNILCSSCCCSFFLCNWFLPHIEVTTSSQRLWFGTPGEPFCTHILHSNKGDGEKGGGREKSE